VPRCGNFRAMQSTLRVPHRERRPAPRTLTVLALGALLWAAFALACTDREASSGGPDGPDGPANGPYSAEEVASRMQRAIDEQGAYTITAQQENLVLPAWGGSDGGTVTVGASSGGLIAAANLHRTGDGDYGIWLRNGQAYFKRSTCRDLARLPGGGGSVLSPFVFLGNDRLRTASDLNLAIGRTTLTLEIDGLGKAEISYDPVTFLPLQLGSLTATNNGKPLVWTFADWGEQPKLAPASAEFAQAYERGPGGNPC